MIISDLSVLSRIGNKNSSSGSVNTGTSVSPPGGSGGSTQGSSLVTESGVPSYPGGTLSTPGLLAEYSLESSATCAVTTSGLIEFSWREEVKRSPSSSSLLLLKFILYFHQKAVIYQRQLKVFVYMLYFYKHILISSCVVSRRSNY